MRPAPLRQVQQPRRASTIRGSARPSFGRRLATTPMTPVATASAPLLRPVKRKQAVPAVVPRLRLLPHHPRVLRLLRKRRPPRQVQRQTSGRTPQTAVAAAVPRRQLKLTA